VSKTSERPTEEIESQDDVTPLAPIDLARGYATLAFELHEVLNKRLDGFEKELSEIRGIAAFGVRRIEEIAEALNVPVRVAKP
jgi:hypothetical protein